MGKLLLSCCLFFFSSFLVFGQKYVIILHGGAGDGIVQENFDEERKRAYDQKMKEALLVGESVLINGGSAVDAVEAVISLLEDSPLFNAGKGAVYTWDAEIELDASIMDGASMNAGAVAGISTAKNPIKAARRVMDSSSHVMLSSQGAEQFVKAQRLEIVDQEYFKTPSRKKALERYKSGIGAIPHGEVDYSKMGTVGCVVLDREGNIAAGTSTGGMTGKRYGRIGDSPVIGAGTYASNTSCGISCTGHGEFFIRYAVAHDIHSRMRYNQQSISEAGKRVIQEDLESVGAKGGVIGVDKEGNVLMEFNTKGMFRAYLRESEEPVMLLFD